jgi:hypothetical protein
LLIHSKFSKNKPPTEETHMKKEFARRSLIVGMGLAALGASMGASAEPNYPTRPVKIIVGFPAGTGPDIVARLLAQKLSEGWNNMGVIVDNKPGAGGLIAASEAARATPDGYTLMLGETGQLSIAPSSYNKLPYDPVKDFAPVSPVHGYLWCGHTRPLWRFHVRRCGQTQARTGSLQDHSRCTGRFVQR